MLKGYGENFTIIPYPCNPVIEGNRKFMEDGLKLFSFGRQPEREYIDFIESLKKLRSRYEFTYKIVRSNGLLTFNEKWIIQEQRRLGETSEIYNLLHSSDIHLLPKRKTDKVVVSSTLCQCLGSLTPTIAPATRHFETLPEDKPILLYKNIDDLVDKLELIIEDEEVRRTLKEYSKKYIEDNRVDKITDQIISLIKGESMEIKLLEEPR